MENESIKETLNSRNSTQVRESKKMVRPVMDVVWISQPHL